MAARVASPVKGTIFERGSHMKISLSDYPSKYFPVQAVFSLNNVRYQLVYESVAEAKHKLSARFYPVKVSFADSTRRV